MDHRYFEPFKELKSYLNKLEALNINRGRSEIEAELKRDIAVKIWNNNLKWMLIKGS